MLNEVQRKYLLRPLAQNRISQRTQGSARLSYLEAWDVKAHLTRIFGFGGWSSEVIESSLVFEEKNGNNWDVAWKVTLRLTIHGIDEQRGMVEGTVCDRDAVYTEAAIGAGHIPNRAESHDMAIKTAESDALKRAAIALGTQFGLSLYDSGATRDVIKVTLDIDNPDIAAAPAETAQPEVSPQMDTVSISGDADEYDPTPDESGAIGTAPEPPADNPEAVAWIEKLAAAVNEKNVPRVVEIKKEITAAKHGRLTYRGKTLSKWCDEAVVKAGAR